MWKAHTRVCPNVRRYQAHTHLRRHRKGLAQSREASTRALLTASYGCSTNEHQTIATMAHTQRDKSDQPQPRSCFRKPGLGRKNLCTRKPRHLHSGVKKGSAWYRGNETNVHTAHPCIPPSPYNMILFDLPHVSALAMPTIGDRMLHTKHSLKCGADIAKSIQHLPGSQYLDKK